MNHSTPQTDERGKTGGFLKRILRLFDHDAGSLSADGAARDRSYLIWTFLIPFSFMLIIYALDGVFPFGDRSVLILDLNGQYIGFYEALRDWIYGEGSLLYSFARSLGGEMMGIYAYYIASPFAFLVALFPEGFMTEALFFIFVLKVGLSGLTFGYYVHRNRLAAPLPTVFFSAMYALCAYAVVMQHNSMWIDNLILLPLITLGIESLIKYRRFRLFVFSLALALLSNFYIGYMTCIYVAIYFFYYTVAYSEGGRTDPLGERRHFLRSFVRIAFYSALAIGIAAIILLTAYYSLGFGKSEFTQPNFEPFIRFTPIEFFTKMLVGSYDTVEPSGLPIVYCGVLTLLLLPLYFANRRFSKRERIATAALLGIFYFSFSINTIDILWHGGQAPNWLNYRYSFIFCFLLLITACRALARIKDIPRNAVLSFGVVLLAFVVLAAACGFSYFNWIAALISAVLIALFTGLLYFIRKGSFDCRRICSLALALAVFCEVLGAGIHNLYMLHMDVGAVDRESYTSYHETMSDAVNWVKEYDTGFYRMETVNHRVTNDVMELGYRGVTNSTSTLNHKTLTFLNRLGLLSTSHWSQYKGSTMAVDSLLGIRYVIATTAKRPSGTYEQIYRNYTNLVYRNPYALPIAYAVKAGTNSYDFTENIYSPLTQINRLVGTMLGEDVILYEALPILSEDYSGLTYTYVLDGDKEYVGLESDVYYENQEAYDAGEFYGKELYAPDASITYTVAAEKAGHIYFYVPTAYKNEVGIYMKDTYIGNLFGSDSDHLYDLGEFEAGEVAEVTLRMDKCVYFYYLKDEALFYYENTDAVAEAMSSLGENGISLTDFREDMFCGHITVTEERPVVLTTIPYDAGWIVTVDGQPIEPYETLDALLAFEPGVGTHEIRLEYRPNAYVFGGTVSLISLAVFLLFIAYEFALRRRCLRLRAGSVIARLSDVFFFTENRLPEEPNYLSDEEMDRAEAAGAVIEIGEEKNVSETQETSTPDAESEFSAEEEKDHE